MANYNIVIDNGIFKPFDYSLALNAIKEYNTGYEKQLAVYDKIALTLGDLASAVEGTEKAKSIYDTYLDRFNQAADSFSRGMNVNNARELGVLRKLYGTQIRQLERANEAMVKEAERRRAEKDPTMMYLDIGNLDNYMEDPNRTLGKYSAAQLTSDVASIAKAIGNSLVSKENTDKLDPYTRVWIQKKGFKKEDIDRAVQEVYSGGIEAVSDPIYKNILQNAMLASGVYNWADESTKARAERAAVRGLYGGIGESTMGTYEDKAATKALDYYYNELKAQNDYLRSLDLLQAKRELDFNDSLGGTYGRSYLEEKEGNGKTRYLNLQSNIQSLIGEDGQLKEEYRTKKGQVGNPLVVYDEYMKYINDHKHAPSDQEIIATGLGLPTSSYGVTDYDSALKHVQDRYGVSKVISKELYDALKSLGYDKNGFSTNHGGSTNYDMSDAMTKLDNLASRKTTSYASGEKITQALAKRIEKGLSHYTSDNALKEVNGQLQDVDSAKWNDISADNINEVGIDIGAKKLVFVTKDGSKYAVDPNIISTDFLRTFNAYINGGIQGIPSVQDIENDPTLTYAQKSQALYGLLEAILLSLMKEVGRGIFLVKGETSNTE